MSNFLGIPLSPQPESGGVTKYNQKVLQKKALKINKQQSKQTKNTVILFLNTKKQYYKNFFFKEWNVFNFLWL